MGSPLYSEIALAYTAGVRAFFAPAPLVEAERAGQAPMSEFASRAATLTPLSVELTGAAGAQLGVDDPDWRIQASIGLLAKTLIDLEVSRALFFAAEEEAQAPLSRGVEETERSAAVARPAHLDDTLQLLLGKKYESLDLAERGIDLLATIEAARVQLTSSAGTALSLIRDRAADTGWEALGGVAKLGAGKLAEAAGLVGTEVAEVLGQAAQVARLYELMRTFLGQAYAALQALLGPALTQVVGEQAVGWIKEAGSGKKFAALLERLYGTRTTGQVLAKLAGESPAGLAEYVTAIQGVDSLEAAYRKQVEVVGKILKALKFVAIVPAAALPQGRLLMAAAYILVGGYIVLAGADYVDAPQLKLLDRVPGVRTVIETNLATAPN